MIISCMFRTMKNQIERNMNQENLRTSNSKCNLECDLNAKDDEYMFQDLNSTKRYPFPKSPIIK